PGYRMNGLRFAEAIPEIGVEVPDVPAIRNVKHFTLAAWTFQDKDDGLHHSIISREITGGAGKEVYNLTFDGPYLVLYVYPEIPNKTLAVKALVPELAGKWHHVAGTYDGVALRIYLDGEDAGHL